MGGKRFFEKTMMVKKTSHEEIGKGIVKQKRIKNQVTTAFGIGDEIFKNVALQ